MLKGNATAPINPLPTVLRTLHLELDGGLWQTMVRLGTNDRNKLETENIATVHTLIEEFQPDVALIWGMWNVPRSVPAAVEAQLPGRVAYYICDYWLSLPSAYIQRWEEDANHRFAQTLKQMVGIPFMTRLQTDAPVGLAVEHPICVSQAVRDLLVAEGVPVGHAKVLHGGTQVDSFIEAAMNRPTSTDRRELQTLRIVTAARLVADKGVHTTLLALGHLKQVHPEIFDTPSLRLDIVGEGDESYVTYLHTLVHEHGLADVVTFCGAVSRSEMPEVLARYDAFIFSSEWQEPFARSVLEAMAAGLLVIGTTTGGTGEILVENETGLTYQAGDANGLAEQLARVLQAPTLATRLGERAQAHVIANHTFEQMVEPLEDILTTIGNQTAIPLSPEGASARDQRESIDIPVANRKCLLASAG